MTFLINLTAALASLILAAICFGKLPVTVDQQVTAIIGTSVALIFVAFGYWMRTIAYERMKPSTGLSVFSAILAIAGIIATIVLFVPMLGEANQPLEYVALGYIAIVALLALGDVYFAFKTRKQHYIFPTHSDDFNKLDEDEVNKEPDISVGDKHAHA